MPFISTAEILTLTMRSPLPVPMDGCRVKRFLPRKRRCLFDGRARDAVSPLRHGLSLNPLTIRRISFDTTHSPWRNFFAGQVKEAIGSAKEALKVRPDWQPTNETLTACYAAIEDWLKPTAPSSE